MNVVLNYNFTHTNNMFYLAILCLFDCIFSLAIEFLIHTVMYCTCIINFERFIS